MDTAINEKTGEIVHAWSLETNASYLNFYEEKWFADPNAIEDYDTTKVKDVTKIEVRFRKGNDEVVNWNGTEYSIAPCFFIPNKSELGINVVPESKEHRLAKNWIYNRIKNKNLVFVFSSVKKPFEYDNTINLKDLKFDLNKVGIEVVVKNNRTQRADVIIPLLERDYFLGNGIVIEIQFSKQWKTTEEKRSYDWAFKGYSICWLHFDDFKKISENLIELKVDRLILNPIDKSLHDFRKENEIELRDKTQILARMIDTKMKELNFPFTIGECNRCKSGYMTKKRAKSSGRAFYGCSNYPECRHCIWISDEDDTN